MSVDFERSKQRRLRTWLNPPREAALRERGDLMGSGSRRLPQHPLRVDDIGGCGRRFAPACLLELFNPRPSGRAFPLVHDDKGVELGTEELGHVRADRLPRER